jgi:hypothetical protein
MPDILYTSSNVADSNVTLVNNVWPNYTYSITTGSFTLEHMRTNIYPSGLVYSNVVNYTGGYSFTAPSDNVSAHFELVRVGTSTTDTQVNVEYSDFEVENYTYDYSFFARAYNNDARTSELSPSAKSPTTITKGSSGTLTLNVSNLTTDPRYFQINTFRNETALCDVYTGPGTSAPSSRLSFNVYDVRGLAYMRDYSSYVEIPRLHYDPSNHSESHSEVKLSADGNKMIYLIYDYYLSDKFKIYTYKRNNQQNQWLEISNTVITNSSITNLYKCNLNAIPGHFSHFFFACAFTKNGDKYLYSIGNTVYIRYFETHVQSSTPIDFESPVHSISISADEKTILVSGNYASGQGGGYLTGPTGGKANIYLWKDSQYQPTNLSSDQIDGFATNDYYGSFSCLSGDGKTAVVFGAPNGGNSVGYVWKHNQINDTWVMSTTITLDSFNASHWTPCALSHDGKVLVFNGANTNGFIYETEDYVTWTALNNLSGSFYSCDVSGNGTYAAFAQGSSGHDVQIYKSNVPFKNINFSGRTETYKFSSCALSYDGSTLGVTEYFSDNLYSLGFDKNVPIATVYDYFNRYSEYYHGYTFDEPNWGTLTNSYPLHGTNYKWYGYQDGAGISKDGSVVVVGSPSENKMYVYTWNGTNNYTNSTITKTDQNFGMTCSVDDDGKYCVIGATSYVYVYDITSNQFKQTISIGTNNTTWNLRISKDGSTVIWTTGTGVTTINGCRTTNDWTSHATTTFTASHSIEAIDLSLNGSMIVGTGNSGGQFSIFRWGNSNPIKTVSQPSTWNSDGYSNYWGQAICVQGNEKKLAISVPHTFGAGTSNLKARVFVYDISDPYAPELKNTPRDIYATGTDYARYGRSVSIAFTSFTDDQPVICVSGTQREYTGSSAGGAIVHFNGNSYTKYQSIATEITNLGTGTTSGLRDGFNGFGIVTRMAANGSAIVVAGGGYAYVYR